MSDTNLTTAVCEEKGPITDELLTKMNAYWRAANYLSACSCIFWTTRFLRSR